MEDKKLETIYEIPAENMGVLSDKIEALNKRAKRLKLPEIVTKVLAVSKKKERRPMGYMTLESAPDMAFEIFTRTYYTVEVLGASPVLPDWEFLGTLEHATDTANILRSVPGFEIPEAYRTGKQKCDHCNKIRSRKDTYIVRNKVSNEVKQVGHNCIADYLGRVSPQQLALFATFVKEMENCGDEGWGGEKYERSPVTAEPMQFLEQACAVIRVRGFVSRAAAMAYSQKVGESGGTGSLQTTSGAVWMNLFPPRNREERRYFEENIRVDVTPGDTMVALDTLSWLKSSTDNSNYMHNLRTVFTKEFFTDRDAGLAASAVGAYLKYIGKEVERRRKARVGENSKYFGTVGKREVFTLTILGEHVFENDFGQTTLFRMIDENGNLCNWWTSSARLEVGHTYKLKGTVKKFDEYKGTKQTIINRCVVVEDLGVVQK